MGSVGVAGLGHEFGVELGEVVVGDAGVDVVFEVVVDVFGEDEDAFEEVGHGGAGGGVGVVAFGEAAVFGDDAQVVDRHVPGAQRDDPIEEDFFFDAEAKGCGGDGDVVGDLAGDGEGGT